MSFPHEDRESVAIGEGLDRWAGAGDAGSADEDHLQRATGESGRRSEDSGVDLAAVGVALYRYVQCREGPLGGVFYVPGEQDAAGTGPEGGGGLDEGLECVEEVVALQEFEHRGGFAARHDQPVDSDEFVGNADQPGGCAECSKGFGVGFVCALEGQDAYGEGFGHDCLMVFEMEGVGLRLPGLDCPEMIDD